MSRARDLANSADNDITGTLTVDDITLSGNITVGGTVDGRDIATDGTKLDGIEANATADQTGAEIKAAYEGEADTNAFTDAEKTKLSGIETGATADQTKADIDALNINADTLDGQHGSYYTSYADTAVANLVDTAPSTLDTLNELAAALGDDPNFSTTVTNNIATKLPLAGGTMTGAITFAAGQTFDGRDVSADGSKLDGIETGATADQTAAEIRALVEAATDSNVFTDADHTKLNGIEAGATADQTASEILTLIKTVDGAGSGLDADTLDGISSASFLRSDANDTMSGSLVIQTAQDDKLHLKVTSGDTSDWNYISFYGSNGVRDGYIGTDGSGNMQFYQDSNGTNIDLNGSSPRANGYTIWHAGNDGSGSGLDADLLDGIDSSNYARTDQFEYFSSGFQVITAGPSLGKAQNQNLKVTGTSGSTDCGITGWGGDGNWDFQLYGYNGQQGFLKSEWGAWAVYTDTSGNWTATGNVTAYSDERLKDNIEVIDNAVDKVKSIRGVTYNRNDDENYVRQAGVIAQEVEKVLPEVVQENRDGIKTVAYGNMVGLLIEAIKEQQAQIDELKAKLEG